MVLERLTQVAQHVANKVPSPHPFDPLSEAEIDLVVSILRKEHGSLFYNAVTLKEPPKAQMMKWLADPEQTPRPSRIVDVVVIGKESKAFEGLVNLDEQRVIKWEGLEGVQPLVSRHS